MTTLTDFLLARIAEDEAVAKAATQGQWLVDDSAEDFPVLAPDAPDFTWDGVFICTTSLDGKADANRADAEHIAHYDPARVLAECEAKRRIIRAAQDRDIGQGLPGSHDYFLMALALPYAGHSDYQEAWRP